MKRRDFLLASAKLAGTMMPLASLGESQPCPPPSIGVTGGSSATQGCAAVTPGGTGPTWFRNIPALTWVELALGQTASSSFDYRGTALPAVALGAWQRGNSLKEVCPWFGSSIRVAFEEAYGGASVDQERKQLIWMAGGGGRSGNYGGNDGYALDLNREVPAWFRLADSTPAEAQVDTYTGDAPAAYRDGRMRASHHYGRQVCAKGRVWWAGQDQYWYSAGGADGRGIWSFNLMHPGVPRDSSQPPLLHDGSAGPWASHGTGISYGEAPAGQFNSGSAAYDPVTDRIWSFSSLSSNRAKWFTVDPNTGNVVDRCNFDGAWGVPATGQGMVAICRGATLSRGLLIIAALNTDKILIWDLSSSANSQPAQLVTANRKVWNSANGAETYTSRWWMVYHAASNSLLAYEPSFCPETAGQVPLRRLKIPTINGVVDLSASKWVWEDYVPDGVRPRWRDGSELSEESTAGTTGTYGKFNIVKDLGGSGADCLVLSKVATGPTYVMKLPA